VKKSPHILKYLQQSRVYIFLFEKRKTAKIVSFIKLDRIQPFKLLKTRYILKTRSHVKALIGVKIVFQIRNRYKLPT